MIVIPNRLSVVTAMSALGLAVGLLTLALLAKPAQAQPDQIFNERLPFAVTTVNPCTSEEVSFEGTQHLVFHSHEDANGGVHNKGHNTIHATGVSASGAKYRWNESINSQNKFNVFSESASNFTLTDSWHIIRQGSATPTEDFVVKQVFHVTVNANGEVTSEVAKSEVECT